MLLMSESLSRLVGVERPDARLAFHPPAPHLLYYVVRYYRIPYISTAHPQCSRPTYAPGEACDNAKTTIKPLLE